MWLAALVSNVGSFMQMVGAQWLLVRGPHAALMVSLVQTVDMIPDLLFGVVGGVVADIFDRRRLLIAAQAALTVTGVVLTVLTLTNHLGPALLLTLTFVLGFGSVFTNPAYQSIIPELVPREQLAGASALGSISVNIARAAGPALAGLVIARAGVGAVFALNTATFLVFGVVVLMWHPAHTSAPQLPERFTSAIVAGARYVRHSPVVRRILLRATLFLVPGSALWALLPLVASARLGLGAGGYGLMLTALGGGAIAGAFLLPRLTTRVSNNALVVAASVVYAAVLAATGLVRNPTVSFILLVPAGVAWMAVLSTMNTEVQLFLPAWVRARGLSIYLTVFFGAQAFGSLLWGLVADPLGVVPTFLAAALLMAAGAATIRVWPLIDTAKMDRRVSAWPEPHLVVDADGDAGPVVVQVTYTIAPESERAFLDAMVLVRQSRLRTGASQWGIFRDGERPHLFVELFVVSSWDEHLRQHSNRQTGTDQAFIDAAEAFSNPPPQTSHLISAGSESW
jgi:MFS family permease